MALDPSFEFQFEESMLHLGTVCMALTDQFVNQQWLGAEPFANLAD